MGIDDTAIGRIGSQGSLSNDMLRTERVAIHGRVAVSKLLSVVSVVNRGTASERTTDPVIALETLISDVLIEPSNNIVAPQTAPLGGGFIGS